MSIFFPSHFFCIDYAGYQLNRNSYIFTAIVVKTCMSIIISNKS